MDPRTSIIEQRLSGINKIIAVSSGKGGVGKSLVATTLALELVQEGFKVGLFDLDFTSPSTHLILGTQNLQPIENRGLIPPTIQGLQYMSIVYYVGNEATPLRGEDTSNALIELLAVTLWNKLDFLVIDTPPGIGDTLLDLIRLVPRIEFLIVTTSSRLSFETVKKQVRLLQELEVPIVGIIENMKNPFASIVRVQTEALGTKVLVEIPYDAEVEKAIGDPKRLSATVFATKIKLWLKKHISPHERIAN
jgi:ATP-binding protein involved in chromosome partitioning